MAWPATTRNLTTRALYTPESPVSRKKKSASRMKTACSLKSRKVIYSSKFREKNFISKYN